MKPWQAPLNKAPSKGGKEEKESDPKATNYVPKPPLSQEAYKKRKKKPEKKNKPKRTFISHKAIKEQIVFQSPHLSQETYQTTKGKGNLKKQ